MGGIGLLYLLTLLALSAALVIVLVRRTTADPVSSARRHETRIAVSAAWGSVASGVVLTQFAQPSYDAAVGLQESTLLTAAPGLACVVFCLLRMLGELTWPRPSGTVRTAPLRRRTVLDIGGWRLAALLATLGAGVGVVVAYGRGGNSDGRSLTVLDPGPGEREVMYGYPGWDYGMPMLVGLGLGLLVTLAALALVLRRAPLAGLPGTADDAVRRTSADRILGGAQLWLGGGIALFLLFGGVVLGDAGHGDGLSLTSEVAGLAVGLVSVGLALGAVLPRQARRSGMVATARSAA